MRLIRAYSFNYTVKRKTLKSNDICKNFCIDNFFVFEQKPDPTNYPLLGYHILCTVHSIIILSYYINTSNQVKYTIPIIYYKINTSNFIIYRDILSRF